MKKLLESALETIDLNLYWDLTKYYIEVPVNWQITALFTHHNPFPFTSVFVLWFNDSESFVINGEEGCNLICTLRYTLENGLSSCLVTSYNDNFSSVIGFSNSCMLVSQICWWVRKCGNICWNYTWCPSRVFFLLLPQWLLTSKSYLIPSEQHLTFYGMASAIFASLHSAKALCLCGFTTCLYKVNKENMSRCQMRTF